MSDDLEQIRAIPDPFARLAAATHRLAEYSHQVTELSQLRRALVHELHRQGYSHADIARAAGLSRGRIHQILH